MSGQDDDSINIRVPAKLAAGILLIGASLGGGVASYVGPAVDRQIISQLQSEIRESNNKAEESLKTSLRAEALGKAAVDLGTQNAKAINANRDFVVERTFDRFTKESHLDYSRKQAERDAQQDRRISGLERDMDRNHVEKEGFVE